MIDKIKLSKDVTLVTESYWTSGNRLFVGRLRPPVKDFSQEEEAVRFEGKHLYIDKTVLEKFGIELHIE